MVCQPCHYPKTNLQIWTLGFHMRCANIRPPAGHSSCAIINLRWHQLLPARMDGTLMPLNEFHQRIGGIISHKCLIANKDASSQPPGRQTTPPLPQKLVQTTDGCIIRKNQMADFCIVKRSASKAKTFQDPTAPECEAFRSPDFGVQAWSRKPIS